MILSPGDASTHDDNGPGRARRRRPWLLLFVFIGSVLTVALVLFENRRSISDRLHAWLDVTQPPTSADAIYVMAGGLFRLDRAVELYNAGYAPIIIIANADFAMHIAAQGVPLDRVIQLPESRNTHQEVGEAMALVQEQGIHSLLVVTSPYHARRTALSFTALQPSSWSGQVVVTGVGYPTNPNWLANLPRRVFDETLAYVAYWLRYSTIGASHDRRPRLTQTIP